MAKNTPVPLTDTGVFRMEGYVLVNEQLLRDLRALGVCAEDTLLVHSSLSALGYVEGGAETVIDTLLAAVSEGTLLMPALSYATVRPETPTFSINETPSCVGAISEAFRKRAGVRRSMHPTHSVCAMGKRAEELLAPHKDTATPAGAGSPFALLPQYGGKVLMLGCGINPNTSMHGVEETVMPPYLLNPTPTVYRLVDETGTVTEKAYRRHSFHDTNTSQRYERLGDVMTIAEGAVLNGRVHLIDAREMWRAAGEKLKDNPFYFVDSEMEST